MELLTIEAGTNTPAIIMDPNHQLISIAGRSLPENAPAFFEKCFEWLAEYKTIANTEQKTIIELKLEYFNTSSSKLIYELLKQLSSLKNVYIKWYFATDDEDMEETGLEFMELINAPFELIEL